MTTDPKDNTHPPFDSLAAGSMKPNVVAVAHEVYDTSQAFFSGHDHPITVMFGYNPASQPEHSAGTAIDFMVYQDWTLGDWIAEYLWTNRARLGLRWQIWRQRIRSTSPGHDGLWHAMEDRGSPTQNHLDHVHANFWAQTYVAPGHAPAGSSTPHLPTPPATPATPSPSSPVTLPTQEEEDMGRIVKTIGNNATSTADDGQVWIDSRGVHGIPDRDHLEAMQTYLAILSGKQSVINGIQIARINRVMNNGA